MAASPSATTSRMPPVIPANHAQQQRGDHELHADAHHPYVEAIGIGLANRRDEPEAARHQEHRQKVAVERQRPRHAEEVERGAARHAHQQAEPDVDDGKDDRGQSQHPAILRGTTETGIAAVPLTPATAADTVARMASDRPLGGIFAPVTTPLLGEEIDPASFTSNLRHYASTALAGIVVLGSNGEAPLLTSQTR